MHKVLEDWLETSKKPNESTLIGKIAAHGLHLLPPPSKHITVEGHFRYQRTSRIAYHGFVDFAYWRRHPQRGLEFVVGDHKTTSNLGYMKTEDKLVVDIQAVIYAAAAIYGLGLDYVVLRWVYYSTKKTSRKSIPVEVVITKEQVEAAMQIIDEMATEVLDMRDKYPDSQKENKANAVALNIKPTPASCGKYGGCSFQGVCNLTPGKRFVSLMKQGQSRMNALQKLKAKNATTKSGKAPEEKPPLEAVSAPEETKTEEKPETASTEPALSRDRPPSVNPPEAPTTEEALAMDVVDNKAAATEAENKEADAAAKEAEKLAKKEAAAKKKAEAAAKKLDLGAFLATKQAAEFVSATIEMVHGTRAPMEAYMAKYFS